MREPIQRDHQMNVSVKYIIVKTNINPSIRDCVMFSTDRSPSDHSSAHVDVRTESDPPPHRPAAHISQPHQTTILSTNHRIDTHHPLAHCMLYRYLTHSILHSQFAVQQLARSDESQHRPLVPQEAHPIGIQQPPLV
mmetsp:Transcript_1479/g.3987  ORF Transcript_1479/g.3987 Transcript_1479/m.3987 type:complete len:137 (-) Transcript_1479:419-829(-)